MQRDMQSEFTFMQMSSSLIPYHREKVEDNNFFELNLGKCIIIACEILNHSEGMDINEMLLQHPHIKEWKLVYRDNYIFSKALVTI